MEWKTYELYFVIISTFFLIGIWAESVFLMRRESRDLLTEIRDALKNK